MRNLGKLTLKEVGQEMSIITHSDALGLKGGDGSSTVYTWAEYEKLEKDGKWNGGYVEGCGYMMSTVTCVGSYNAVNPIVSTTSSFCDWVAMGSCNYVDQLASVVLGVIPYGIGDMFGYLQDKIACERNEAILMSMQGNLLCTDTARFNLVVTDDLTIYYDVFTEDGYLICSTKDN